MNTIGHVGEVAVGSLFVVGAIAKARSFSSFLAAIQGYGIIKTRHNLRLVGGLVLSSEALSGPALLLDVGGLVTRTGVIVLLITFTTVIIHGIVGGKTNQSCGCRVLGRSDLIGWPIVLRNMVLISLLLLSELPVIFGIVVFLCIAVSIVGGARRFSSNSVASSV